MRSLSQRLLAAFVLSAWAASLGAASNPDTFGVQDQQVVTLSHVAFLPTNHSTTYFSACCANDSYRHPTAGPAAFFAPIDAGLVPNGAVIERVEFFVRDSTSAADAEMRGLLCLSSTDLDGSSPSGDCPYDTNTTGSPGDTVLALQPNATVLYTHDADGDGDLDAVHYVLAVQFGINGNPDYSTNLRLRGARILYRRQISPPPASATFNDVPSSHPFFQFVEALAASGITAGCGSGSYCPDAPLTRGQMAVFLSKALGLYWPAE